MFVILLLSENNKSNLYILKPIYLCCMLIHVLIIGHHPVYSYGFNHFDCITNLYSVCLSYLYRQKHRKKPYLPSSQIYLLFSFIQLIPLYCPETVMDPVSFHLFVPVLIHQTAFCALQSLTRNTSHPAFVTAEEMKYHK